MEFQLSYFKSWKMMLWKCCIQYASKFGKFSSGHRTGKAREFQKNISFCFIDYAKASDCVDHNKLRKILQVMGIPDHLTCLFRNLYARQEATVRTGDWTDWFQIRKGVPQGCTLSPCLFNLYAEYIMRVAGLEEAQAGIKIAGRNIRAYYTEWSKPERKTPIQYTNVYIWNLERW